VLPLESALLSVDEDLSSVLGLVGVSVLLTRGPAVEVILIGGAMLAVVVVTGLAVSHPGPIYV